MRKGNRSFVLMYPSKHFDEDILHQILLGRTAGKMGAHDPDNQWIEMIDQVATSRLIARTHGGKATR